MNTGQPDPSRRGNRRRRPGGFTLMELVVAMFITTVLAVGMGSVMLIAMHATPKAQGPMIRTLEATRIADQIAAELHSAVTVIQSLPTLVEFTVDRGGVSHTIRYAWSTTPGDPLTRQYDGGSVISILDNVQDFSLAYRTRTATTTTEQTTVVEGAELASFTGWSGITPTTTSVGLADNWKIAESFTLNLPADVTKLDITRATLKMRQGTAGDAGAFTVAIHRTVSGGNPEPASNPLGTPDARTGAYLPAPSSPYEWRDFFFSDVGISNPDKAYTIVVTGTVNGMEDARVELLTAAAAPKDTTMAMWNDGSNQWSPENNTKDENDYPFFVYGTYETTKAVSTDTNVLQSVEIRLSAGPAPALPVDAEALTLNNPELP